MNNIIIKIGKWIHDPFFAILRVFSDTFILWGTLTCMYLMNSELHYHTLILLGFVCVLVRLGEIKRAIKENKTTIVKNYPGGEWRCNT